MSSQDKINSMRTAIITSNDRKNILEVLETELPSGYEVKHIEPEKKSGNYDIVIQTPNDEICIKVDKEGFSATTSNIMKQDQLDVQPSLKDDELSKLARLLFDNEQIDMRVIASNNDLKD
ncbi:hypothetical protein OW684_01800 [Acinetobacter baumannii]|uniref:hypothetical protein n=1 Tax=Acinetobacter baumannii TaxID=470 RepID=UPI00233E7839|nr:hypothetical protein [Acinetobacter baumannii]MDC4658956.1 hypothetical protein [Acinetobacter baumannii]MDC4789319.1 hypothetical protein [Acinetobacter baumannii]MDC5207189.1 hypothetical protein [Acinetobacter baumannii]MDC5571148.1 hypothetical protein [Acinetobacter baumannii]MDK2105146.1 hypothetical protein [Acinetobacter baumannii]